MKKTKQILSLFLSVCMIISCMVGMSATASAAVTGSGTQADPWQIGKETASDVTAWLTGEDNNKTLHISGTGAMMDFNQTPWWAEIGNITAVSIGNGVTSIGCEAFRMCSNLASVTIPSGVTSIGEDAFYSCKALESVTIPNSVTSIVTCAFIDCTSLTSVTFERPANTGSLSVGGNAFVNIGNNYQPVPSTAAIAYSGTGSYALFNGDTEITTSNTASDLNGLSLTWKAKSTHTHSFTYSATDATITAACTGDGDCDYKATGITLTLNAPTKTTYGDTGSASATITGYPTTAITNLAAAPTTVTYYNSTGEGSTTTSGSALAAAPEDAGNYVAQFTWGGATASKAYSIAKADPTAPTGLNATYGQKLSDVVLPTGWTWTDSTQSVGSVGSNTFKANFAGDDNYNAVSNVDVSVTVGKAANPATVTGTASVTSGGKTVDLSANVTKKGATGNVTYAISGSDLGCSVNASTGVFTSGTTAGTVTVNVTIAEDSNYNALAATPITVTISDKTAQTITASDVTATYGDTGKSVSATTDGDGTISYSIKSGDAVTVDATTGALTIVKAGSAVITVTAAETDNYAAATKDITVTVNKKDPTTPTGLTAKTGQTLADVALPTGWAWADAGTTSVGEVGDNKFKANYTPTDATNYNSKTDVELTVKVSAAFVPVTAIELNYSTYSMKVGESNALSTSFTPADATNLSLTYTSSNTSVVTISDIGLFTAVGLGTATLTVTATNGTADTSDDVTATCVVTVTAPSGGNSGGYTPVIPSGGTTTTTTTTTTNTGSFADKTEENNNYAGAEINMKTEDLEKAVLTDEDKKVIAAGGNVTVELEVEEKTPTAEEKKEVEAAVEAAKEASGEDYTVAMYFDANLFKTSNGTKTQLHETNGKIAVSFKLPEKYKNTDSSVTRTYAVARIHDGKTEILVCEYDPETDLLTFYTDKFSTYALMYEDAKADDADVSAVDDDDEQGDEGVVDDEQFDETDDDFDELTDDEGDFDDDFAEDQTDGDSDTDNDDQAAVDAVVDNGETNPNTGAPLAGMGVFAVMSFFAATAAYTAKKRKNK